MGVAAAGVGSALALGLRDALGPKQPIPIVVDDPGGELPAGDMILFFHPQAPEATLVLVFARGGQALD